MLHARHVAVAVALGAGLLVPPAAQAARPAADPTRPGGHSVQRLEYDAGPTVLSVRPQNGTPVLAELHGEVFVPSGHGPFPVVVFEHGRHSTCSFVGFETLGHPCPKTPATEPIDSYRGYDYLAQSLASNGYLVASIDANGINTFDTADRDAGAQARAELISRSLDLLTQWGAGTGPGDLSSRLHGRVDVTRLGLMGHSRGGEGVTYWLGYNERRTDGPRYKASAVFALAPIDFTSQIVSDVPWATLLPRCDGDVYDMEGAWTFERAKYALPHRRSPLFQFIVEGANHNWFNTTWTGDDADRSDAVCNPKNGDTARLTAPQQRRVGLTFMAAFLRRYVGGERSFEPLLTGAGNAAVACSRDEAVPCRALVHRSYLPPVRARETLLEPRVADNGVYSAERGVRMRTTGAVTVVGCDSLRSAIACPRQRAGSATSPGWSYGPQLTVTWSGVGEVSMLLGTSLRAQSSDDLVLRVAADVGPNNEDQPQRPGTNYVPFQLVLTDGAGHRAVASVTPAFGAPEPPPGVVTRNLLLSDVRVPLRAFEGVDLSDLRAVGIHLGVGRHSGQLQIADVAVQQH